MDRPRVFVVVEDSGKNILPALDFGDLVPVLESGAQITLASAPAVRKIRTALNDYCDNDYILAIGDPVAIGIACAVAAEKTEGKFRILKWDRQERRYYPVNVDIGSAVAFG